MRSLPRTAVRAVAAAAFTTGLCAALSATPASAAPTTADAALAPAPSCVRTRTTTGTFTKTFRMTNTCNYTVRARMILARHSDTDCITLGANGGWYQVQVARTAALSGVVRC